MKPVYRHPPAPTQKHGSQPRPSDSALWDLLGRLDAELIVVELAAHAALNGDELPVEDLDRVRLAIRRMEFIVAPLNFVTFKMAPVSITFLICAAT